MSRLRTPRTARLRGLSTKKSYHTITPPPASTRAISPATAARIAGSRIEVNTVLWSTTSNRPDGHGRLLASPARRSASAPSRARAAATRSSSRSIPASASRSAPQVSKSASHWPAPQPTSRIRRPASGNMPARRNSFNTARSRDWRISSSAGAAGE
jgi:hypothetical protein